MRRPLGSQDGKLYGLFIFRNCTKKKKTRRKILQASRGKNSTRFTEKNPYKMHTFCHREEKTIEHNILGKGDRIQKIRFPLEGI